MRHTLNVNYGMGRPLCCVFKAVRSHCFQSTESTSTVYLPLCSIPRSDSNLSLNRQGLVQLFLTIGALNSFWSAQVNHIKKILID